MFENYRYYLVEKSSGHPDSPHIGYRALLEVNGDKVSFHRGSLNEQFKIGEDGKPFCPNDNSYIIFGPINKNYFNEILNWPPCVWGDLTKESAIHSFR